MYQTLHQPGTGFIGVSLLQFPAQDTIQKRELLDKLVPQPFLLRNSCTTDNVLPTGQNAKQKAKRLLDLTTSPKETSPKTIVDGTQHRSPYQMHQNFSLWSSLSRINVASGSERWGQRRACGDISVIFLAHGKPRDAGVQGPKTGHAKLYPGAATMGKGDSLRPHLTTYCALGGRAEQASGHSQQRTGVHICRISGLRASISYHLQDENNLILSLAVSRPIPAPQGCVHCQLTYISWDLGQVSP